MAIKHNNQIQKNHFRKDWQRRVRTHFDQPTSKIRRRLRNLTWDVFVGNLRRAKAVSVAPRPVDKLRPIVRCPTIKYNRRVRAGRGFSLTELKAAGIPRLVAPTIGISVDARRQNLSEESLAINVERLKAYKARLIVFPRKGAKHPKAGDSKDIDLSKTETISSVGAGLPIIPVAKGITEVKKSEMPKPIEGGAYKALRTARSDKRNQGARKKRAQEKADAEAAKK